MDLTLERSITSAQNHKFAIMSLCILAAVMEGIDIQSTGLVAPQYSKEFGFSKEYLGTYIFGLNNFGMFLGSILAGWATDKMGRRWTAILAMLTFGVFSLGSAVASSGTMFTVFRALIGLGIGGSLANIIAIMAEAGSVRNRVTRVTLMTGAVAVGGATPGALLTLWPALGWRVIYHIGGWMPVAVGLAMILWLPESIPYLRAKEDTRSNSVSGRTSAFAELFKADRSKLTLTLWIASFGAFLIYYVINNWLPSLMVARHFDTSTASLGAVMFTGGGAIGTVVLGIMLGRNRQFTVVLTFIGCIAAVSGLALTTGVNVVLPMAFALGAFATTAKNMMYGFAPLYYPVRSRGVGVGVAVAWGRIGSIVGPAAAGLLLGGGRDTKSVLLSLIPVLILTAIAMLALGWVGTPETD